MENSNKGVRISNSLKLFYQQNPEHWSADRRKKVGDSLRLFYEQHPEHLIFLSEIMKGRRISPKTEIKKGQRLSPKTEFKKGDKFWLGKQRSEETKIKISLRKQGKPAPYKQGEKCNFWRGGKSFEEYPQNWTKWLRRSIRERDNYSCGLCGLQQMDNTFDVHHIDYDKKNCNPNNLITLCRICHNKTSLNRKYWAEHLKRILIARLKER